MHSICAILNALEAAAAARRRGHDDEDEDLPVSRYRRRHMRAAFSPI